MYNIVYNILLFYYGLKLTTMNPFSFLILIIFS